MAPHLDYNPIMNLWKRLGSNKILNHFLSKWFKFIKLCTMIVLGSVQNKCITHKLILNFMNLFPQCHAPRAIPCLKKALADCFHIFPMILGKKGKKGGRAF
jgi:hypothetical protein